MLRDPSIHIKKSDLLRICKEEGITFPEDFVANLMIKASKIKLQNRVYIVTKAQAARKAARLSGTNSEAVDPFNKVYYSTLMNHNMKSKPIHKGTKAYLTLREVADNAAEFWRYFKIPSMDEAFKIYVGLGITLLGTKFTIYRLKGADSKIRDRYENMEILENTPPMQVHLALAAWSRSLKEFHDLSLEVNIDQMADLARASQDATKAGADIMDWMDAQFDKWTFMNSMPEFSQLHGDNAQLAYVKYMASQKREFTNDAERTHFKTVKDEKEIPIKGAKLKRGSQKA